MSEGNSSQVSRGSIAEQIVTKQIRSVFRMLTLRN